MKYPTTLLLFLVATAPAGAVDYRWTSGFAQGTIEAIIRNSSKASLNIYCPTGQIDRTPGMFVHTDKVRPRRGERIDIQIVIDVRSHAFYLDESQFTAAGRANEGAFVALNRALLTSKGRSFSIEFPKFGAKEIFSLLDVRRALADGQKLMIESCL